MQTGTITMENGQAQMRWICDREPTLAEQAMRLELFELAQREYRIERLECEIATLKGKLFAAENAAGQQDQQEIDALRVEIQQQTQKAKELRTKVVQQEQSLLQLQDYVGELEAGANELGNQRDKLQEECHRLAVNNTTLDRKLSTVAAEKAALEKELKELRQLDPKRLKKQLADLKKANGEKQNAIEELRKQNHRFVKDNKAKALQIEQLDKALGKACDEINEGNAVTPLESHNLGALGKWDIFGSPELNRYDVLDKTNNVSYGVTIQNGQVILPKVRALPKSLQKVLVARSTRYNATEQAIADAQQPLEQ